MKIEQKKAYYGNAHAIHSARRHAFAAMFIIYAFLVNIQHRRRVCTPRKATMIE